ncbi:YbaL family putative K(+) efflux transporter [Bartonella tamiae]|uniref:Monovalent cation:proton antiporter-2 (CPA2) family transporter n=1 Tax=Bartonella tamiae Th239 TaxID=1094558 RepID=J0ZKX7_9HYPH|nr:YbaL family putative K(+) efflux transporter [Bartonella tamiae]EJF89023.1 monovalent cation:proton antiporter-2 (CPA2) family transporter [Bartonella tamiae Th239]EJF94727.1 monovalent cation:proton antiporter-2 (CPA2) family transporter [Bartonella tamiae Th307]
MPHDTPLITTIVVGLCLAYLFGITANRLRISPLVGYLLAGVIVGPYTGGFRADPEITNQLAEIGVILLMFGVGLHFSLKDLLSVKTIAIPGAIAQMLVATLLGVALGSLLGWSFATSILFGVALSTASTVVLIRALQERRLIETERGKIAVGWLIVEDMAMVLCLVLVPALASIADTQINAPTDPIIGWLNLGIWGVIGFTIIKVILFIAVMLIVGRRLIPWLLKITAQSGSRELFRLGVLAIALGVAFGAATLFGVSLALGAFFAGMIMSESELSHRAAEETLPLRDAFAVLFFISVGMLFNPIELLQDFFPLLATLFIIIIGKSFAAFFIVRAFRHSKATALTISASLAQIGEFSFILASLGSNIGLLNDTARDLIVAGAILSILFNPLVFIVIDKLKLRFETIKYDEEIPTVIEIDPIKNFDNGFNMTTKSNHIVIVGYGRVGKKVAQHLFNKNENVILIEDSTKIAESAKQDDIETICGNAINRDILIASNIIQARQLIIAMRSTIEAGEVLAQARAIHNNLMIITHAVSEIEAQYLLELGANIVVTDEDEIANGILKHIIDPCLEETQNLDEETTLTKQNNADFDK